MKSLETKIPLPFVFLIVILAMILSCGGLHAPQWPFFVVAIVAWVAGIGMIVAAVSAFRRAGTTGDPTNPYKASRIVTTGIYGLTRNPMYLSLTIILIGLAFYLATGWVLIWPLVFGLYIHRFQIEPEERALSEKFGIEYEQYMARVRRWL